MCEIAGDRPWHQDWPEGVPRNVEIPEVGLGELLRDTAHRYPDKKALVFLDSLLSYRELDEAVDRFASALHRLGLVRGEVVALMLPNSHQFVIAFFACQRLGLTVTAINPTYKPAEVKHQLRDSGARALIVLDAIFEVPARILGETGVEHVIGTNIVDLCGFSGLKRWIGRLLGKIPSGRMPAEALRFPALLEQQVDLPEVTIAPADDLAVLQYTGGTTGRPKGAMLTHRNLVANAVCCQAWLGDLGEGEFGAVGVLPLFHIYAMTCVMNVTITVGGFQLLFPRPPEDMHEWARQLQKWGRGARLNMPGVAVLFNKINNTPGLERYDLGPLEQCLSGAGPLPREVQRTFEEKFDAKVVEGYGLSETSPVATANPFWQNPGQQRVYGSVGLPLPNTEIKIVDLETGEHELPAGEAHVGEICIKGPQVMRGYLNQPEENARALRDGWFHSGDVGYMDERGWTFIKDRAKDLVKVKGFSVFPKEVEDYIYEHPQILEAAVIGVPHPKVGEAVKAFVVLKPEARGQVTEEQIIAWCGEQMAAHKVPTSVEFRDELPKTLVGKVLRRVLREEQAERASC